jgi:hypothetical protein
VIGGHTGCVFVKGEKSGTAHTYVDGQGIREYSNINLQDTNIPTPQDIPQRIEAISTESKLKPDVILQTLHDFPIQTGYGDYEDDKGQKHTGYAFSRHEGDGVLKSKIINPKTGEEIEFPNMSN